MTTASRNRPHIVGVGASAGGLEAIRELLAPASPDANLAFVVIQHLDPNHDSMLADLLGRQTELKVQQADGGEVVEGGNVYIIPPGYGLSIEEGQLRLTDFPQPRGLRRPIDDFFERLAEDQGSFASCVILSGTGADGTKGLRAIKEHGGLCIVQDPETARYDGMPLSAQATGLVDFTRAPDRIVDCILRFHENLSLAEDGDAITQSVSDRLDDICGCLKDVVGHDFTDYKSSTLVRRVERRIRILDLEGAEAYLARLQGDREECDTLFRDLLINVTRFFRDSEQFDALRDKVIVPLVRDPPGDEIRVWVPGCSSGEEAYSIAMLVADAQDLEGNETPTQIFATDIDRRMLDIARSGAYPLSALADIPERLRDKFTLGREGKFEMTTRIRDMVRFSPHNLVNDPPFSKVDLVSCRNLLIYFGERLQQAAPPIFHYAIRPGGHLFLGPSEGVGRFENLFSPTDARSRIFVRNEGEARYPKGLGTPSTERLEPTPRNRAPARGYRAERAKLANERLLDAFAPPAIQVSRHGEILHSTGRLSRYLSMSPGDRETQYAQQLARPGLREAVSALVRQVGENGSRSISRDLVAASEFGNQPLDLIGELLSDGTVLLVFRSRGPFEAAEEEDYVEVAPSDTHVQALEDELRDTKGRLSTTVEELETANEELKSSNEEMMSMNEELQSTNEELSTVNDELKSKVDELTVANADLQNFFDSTTLPLVVLDGNLRIRNFTDATADIFPLREGDRGRPIEDVRSHLEDHDLSRYVRDAIEVGEPRTYRLRDKDRRRTWSLAITPYRTAKDVIEGATLVYTEITEALRLEEALRQESQRLRLALEVGNLGVWEYDLGANEIKLDANEGNLLGISEGWIESEDFFEMVLEEDRPALREALRQAREGQGSFDVTFRHEPEPGQVRYLRSLGRELEDGGSETYLCVSYDVTPEHETARVREVMLREMNHRVKNHFSVISGMLRLAGRRAETPAEVVENVESRISALARSHDMTQDGLSGESISMQTAVEASLDPYVDTADVTISGPHLALAARELTALSLLLHEWATNASKYGVLGPIPGRLEVSWFCNGDDEVQLVWNETYDQPFEPERSEPGFGSTLIETSSAQLNGAVELDRSERGRKTVLTYKPSRP